MSNRNLTDEQIKLLQQTIKGSGALAKVEQQIEELGDESLNALAQLDLDDYAKQNLRQLALKVIHRDR